MENLIEKSFNKHYKNIQSFRNQYLNMIRTVLKNQDGLTFEDIMRFNDIENRIYNIRKDITNYSTEIKQNKKISNKKISNKKISNIQIQILKDDSDLKMIKTLEACLPIMIYYYNSLDDKIFVDGIPLD
jgi:hypothetical protein